VEAKVSFPSLIFDIIDTGVGIDNDKFKELFTAFNKIMKNRNLNREGVGLGLTISKNLAIKLGGDLLVESTVNVGSKFTVILPNFRLQHPSVKV
jgi:signal transduction histidine kinase